MLFDIPLMEPGNPLAEPIPLGIQREQLLMQRFSPATPTSTHLALFAGGARRSNSRSTEYPASGRLLRSPPGSA